jgi:hypothetical protein
VRVVRQMRLNTTYLPSSHVSFCNPKKSYPPFVREKSTRCVMCTTSRGRVLLRKERIPHGHLLKAGNRCLWAFEVCGTLKLSTGRDRLGKHIV